jgi:hypothetical protein
MITAQRDRAARSGELHDELVLCDRKNANAACGHADAAFIVIQP